MVRWVLVLVVGSIIIQSCSAQQAFLQEQLPLKVLVTTPTELAADAASGQATAVTLTGRQALTAVFSRPVIALGSDWGSAELPQDLVPFTLSCKTPGRLRWVTTNIARFDPSIDWPTDLDCSFIWNKALKTFDGASLQLGNLRPSVRLQTQPLAMNVQAVQSAAAMAATDGQWSAMLGSPDDRLPEVPPDGNITLSFSYSVELSQLAKSLKVAGPGAGSRTVTVSPCPAALVTLLPVPLIFTANGAQGSTADSSSSGLLAMNSTCAVVKIVPGLEPGAAAVLRLAKGAKYSSVAGPVTNNTEVDVYGLRPFRIPLRWDFNNITSPNEPLYNGVMYRRLTMWLPHGLAKDTQLNDVKNAIQLCCLKDPFGTLDSSSNCVSQGFELNRPFPAVLSMRVPKLNPRQRCAVRIKADAKVKDAFGLQLQSSRDVWWAQDLDPAFNGPSVRQVALLETAPGSPTLNWPWVSRGTPEDGLKQVQAVSVPVTNPGSSSSSTGGSSLLERAISGMVAGFGGAGASLLSTAGVKLTRKDTTSPSFQSLALSGQPGISLVGSCCRQLNWPSPRDVLSTSAMVVQSDLQAAFIEQQGKLVAWVTTTQGQSKPVANAWVQIYSSVYGVDAATPGPSCTTSPEGTCGIDLNAAKAAQQKNAQPAFESATLTAVITAEGHGPLVVPQLPNSGRYRSSSDNKDYVATLVLDRKLVKPGDELHVTAFIQRREGSQLKVAQDLTSVTFQVSPGFDRNAASRGSRSGSTPTSITAAIDRTYGTARAIIPVPKNATPATYNLQLWVGAPASAPGSVSAAVPISAPSSRPLPVAVPIANAASARPAGPNARKQEAGPVRPVIAVNPKPKNLVNGVLTFPATKPAGKVLPVPPVVHEPHVGAKLSTNTANTSTNTSTQGVGRRHLQQDDGDEAPAGEAAGVEEKPVVDAMDPVVPETLELDAPSGASPSSLPSTGSAAPVAEVLATPGVAQSPPLLQPKGVSVAYATFTVGDPRPPTASLALTTASSWVQPDGSLTLTATTKSYVGSDVSGAQVTVKWSTAKASGEMMLQTNASGVASGTVELSKLPAANRSEPGDSLTLKATWVGPTREPLMQSKTAKIADGPVRVELQRTLLTNVPGVSFGVRADAFSNEDDSAVKGATVEISLAPRNGSASLSNCTTEQRSRLDKQKCTVKAGDPAAAISCQLMLPCAGEFVLKGCIRGSSNATGCSKAIKLGRNMTSWVSAPWSSGPGRLNLLADKKNVSLGGDVALVLQNPFWGPVSALVVWGNGQQQESFYLDQIPPGPSTIVIQEVGPECRGGCNVVVTLAVARPQAAQAGSQASSAASRNTAGAPVSNQPANRPAAGSNTASQGRPSNAAPGRSPVAPRGLAGSTPADSAAEGDSTTGRQVPAGGGGGPTTSNSPVVRTFNRLWPFSVRVNMPAGSSNMRDSLFGNRGSSGRRRVATTRAGNERGNAANTTSNTVNPLPGIPRSKLYDPYAPVTVSAEIELQVPDTDKLQVLVSVSGQSKGTSGMAVVAPQSQQGSISVSVKDASGAAVPGAEVTLIVVDKAILDLMPYPLQDVSGAMSPKVRAAFSLLHLNDLRVTRSAINATFSTLQRRLTSLDPWLPVDTQVTPADMFGPVDGEGDAAWLPGTAAVDIPDGMYLKSYTTALTPLPYRPCPPGAVNCVRPMVAHSHGNMATMVSADGAAMESLAVSDAVPAPAPMAAAMPRAMAKSAAEPAAAGAAPANAPGGRNAGQSAAAAGAQLRLQQAFKVTPLFKVVKAGADGKVSLNFTAPDNLGRFVVRAYAAAPKAAVKAANGSSAVVYGAGESELTVRRTVSLVPSLPRQVRVGDKFSAGVLVEAPGTVNDVAVTVTAALQQPSTGASSRGRSSQALAMGGANSRTVTLTPGKSQQEVRFDFTAGSIGTQNITFTASQTAAGTKSGGRNLVEWASRGLQQLLQRRPSAAANSPAGALADQVQLQVPVNGKQAAVSIATSFAVRGSKDGNSWTEGMVLPQAEVGSGSINLVAGVGSMPAILAAYTGLAEQGLESSRCTSGAQAVALTVLPAFLSLYQQPGSTASSALSAQQVSLTQAASTAASGKLTHARFGLLPLEPSCMYPSLRQPDRTDVALNAWGSWLVQQALGRDRSSPSGSKSRSAGALSGAWSGVQAASQTWQKALETQLVTDAVSARQGSRYTPPGPYSDLETLSWARLVLRASWVPTVQPNTSNSASINAGKNVSEDVKRDLSMQRLTAAALAGNLTVGGQARVGLALLKDPKAAVGSSTAAGKQLTAAEAVKRLSNGLIGNIRAGGRTAYVASGPGQRGAAGMSDQALALSFLVDANGDNPLVQKLSAWVAQGTAPPPLFFAAVCVSSNPWAATLRSQALTSYDSSTASLTPNLKLTVNAQPKPTPTSKKAPVTLLTAGFTPQQAGKLASSSTSWSGVPANSTLVFGAQGTGEVSVAAALNFTPADLLPFPTYRGLWVQRVVLWEQNTGSSSSNSGGSVRRSDAGVGLGKIVTVAVQVTSPDDQADVVVEALIPGGLEPLDPNVFKDADAATICSSGNEETPLVDGSNNAVHKMGGFSAPASISIAPMIGMMGDEGSTGGFRFWRPIWPVCPQQTTAPDRVTFRFGYMRAGTHTMRFKAVAATSGTFVLPPVKASVQQQPEVMGLSPAGTLTVCLNGNEACAAAASPAAAAPAKACPQDCNGNGACNLASGVCICDSGFGGASCGDLATY